MKRCVIIGGAKINNYSEIKKMLCSDDFYIFCDSGLCHKNPLGITPDLIIGDFDSHPRPDDDCEIIALPREKDDTDTFFAAKEALRRGFCHFLLIGTIGQRLDHTLGNLSIMLMLHSRKLSCKIIDDFSEMEIVDNIPKEITPEFPFFSVINIDGVCSDVTIENAKFPLSHSEISPEYQFGISNEAISGKSASVSVGKGRALLIKIRKEN